MNDPYSPDYALACSALWGSHSDDRTNVWHGAGSPAYLCGRHAAHLTPADYVTMRRAGTIL